MRLERMYPACRQDRDRHVPRSPHGPTRGALCPLRRPPAIAAGSRASCLPRVRHRPGRL